jgi:hypothetical protein
MEAPRYARDGEELEALRRQAKAWRCPHCRQAGYLNGHGVLRGLSADGTTKTAQRGRRFFCSNRGRRRGCGRTVAILGATVLKHATVRAGPFWRFVAARLGGQSIGAAFAACGEWFSLEAAYRWWRRWRRGESAVRTVLTLGRDPPTGALIQQIMDVYGAADPIGAFQYREQRGWP